MTAVISLAKPAPTTTAQASARRYVQRAELALGLPDYKALASLGLSPDPLQQLAAAMASVRTEDGEKAEAVFDLVPVSEQRLARRRRRLMARAARRGPSAYGERLTSGLGGGGFWGSATSAWSGGADASNRSERIPRQTDLRDGVGKLEPSAGAVFAVQILLRTEAAHPQLALARMHQLIAALSMTSGENYLKAHRPRRWAIGKFERRFASGEFAPHRRQWLTVPELAGWLKPPTVKCTASSVVRTGGLVPPAPADLPVYTGQRDLIPLGAVVYPDGRERIAGARVQDLLFGLQLGKAGHGKTEEALVQCIAMAHSGYGCWFLDPHGEGWARAKPYLAHPEILDRIWEINLAKAAPDQPVVSWNPLSMEGRPLSDVQDIVRSVTEGIAAAQDWGDNAPRARTILARASQALALLNLQAVQAGHPEAQCTLFQLRTWLTDEDWREGLLRKLPDRVRAYWELTFPKLGPDAVPTVTYAIDRLDTSQSLQGFFGSPRSAYDVRHAMDTGKVVFVCPSGSESDALVSCLLIHDLHRAGLSRQDTPREQRKTFWAWGDELTTLDSSSKGFLAAIAEQLRKYEVRFIGMTQMVLRLSAITRQALLQNQSWLSACAADYDEAAFVAKRWNGHVSPETITELPKYHYVMSVNLNGARTTPFRVRGLPVDEVFAHYKTPADVPALDQAIDNNLNRRPLGDILADLEELDAVVLAHHTGRRPGGPSAGDPTSVID
ncbi:ATP/GTP-binding protein [Streptomyces sp. MB09-01]|uniref:ATP/GTP-binding protein n=1 Tax=Streptomyces sp. MB09-01 TaxID=3028666 RepID=UPI0029A51B76|nr:ATP/GTP-binding protein [Streptomyces sp. MB09-01]MDX3538844.1 ATP/GTP-binding protein [Streptomyces sp. MB09-01]MDX3538851.1 ATP/GTP-binding protein [Streptomyces sp. MB09-01]